VILPIWQLTVAEAASLATRAEELGLDGVFVPDHSWPTRHDADYGGHWRIPSRCSPPRGRTQRISLGASVIVLPYRNPLCRGQVRGHRDQASGGRFIFGVGVGWDEAESWTCAPFHERGRLSDDYIAPSRPAFVADIPQYSGKYVSFAGATSPRGRSSGRIPPSGWAAPGAVSGPAVRRSPSWATPGIPSRSGSRDREG